MTGGRVAKVLVIDGSDDVRRELRRRIALDPGLEVAADTRSGDEALVLLGRVAVDVIFVNGPLDRSVREAVVRAIMTQSPRPIVLGSVLAAENGALDGALDAGAVACVPDPVRLPQGPLAADWLQTLKAMAEVRVVTRRHLRPADRRPPGPERIRIVAIGASTGGPLVLQQILSAWSPAMPVPVVIVQHIARGFLNGMASWLRTTTGQRILIAAHGMVPRAGHVYLAPDDFEIGVGPEGALVLSRPEAVNGPCPSVAGLFASVARHFGAAAVGVLLTGMGNDGARELRGMRDRGAITIAQDRASSAVHGMPGQAIALGGATHVLPADRIGPVLVQLVTSVSATRQEPT